MSNDLLLRELGAITAKLESLGEGQERLEGKFEKFDDRLRTVEKGAAVSGALTGGIMSVAVGLIMGALKGGSS